MSMSDGQWQAWKPVNLLHEHAIVDGEGPLVDEGMHRASAEKDAPEDLQQLRQREAQRGFAQGKAQGEEQGHRVGYEAGFAQGKAEGTQQGLIAYQQQQGQLSEQFSRLLDGLQASMTQLDNLIPMRLMQIALEAVRLLLHEPTVSEAMSAGLLRHISQLLKDESLLNGPLRICISADEADAVREPLATLLADRDWTLFPDPHLLPGGCCIETENGELDATLDTRWQSLCQLIRQGGE